MYILCSHFQPNLSGNLNISGFLVDFYVLQLVTLMFGFMCCHFIDQNRTKIPTFTKIAHFYFHYVALISYPLI